MDVKAKIGRAIVVKATEEGVAPGMIVDTGVDDDPPDPTFKCTLVLKSVHL